MVEDVDEAGTDRGEPAVLPDQRTGFTKLGNRWSWNRRTIPLRSSQIDASVRWRRSPTMEKALEEVAGEDYSSSVLINRRCQREVNGELGWQSAKVTNFTCEFNLSVLIRHRYGALLGTIDNELDFHLRCFLLASSSSRRLPRCFTNSIVAAARLLYDIHPTKHTNGGGFKVSGRICTQCLVSDPLVGELTVETSAIATETSIVQTTQIADGDVCRTISLPVYLILPRLLTCLENVCIIAANEIRIKKKWLNESLEEKLSTGAILETGK
ncbi:hypothetical protein LXL04_008722 [Taraxacum kok-saghyz]